MNRGVTGEVHLTEIIGDGAAAGGEAVRPVGCRAPSAAGRIRPSRMGNDVRRRRGRTDAVISAAGAAQTICHCQPRAGGGLGKGAGKGYRITIDRARQRAAYGRDGVAIRQLVRCRRGGERQRIFVHHLRII